MADHQVGNNPPHRGSHIPCSMQGLGFAGCGGGQNPCPTPPGGGGGPPDNPGNNNQNLDKPESDDDSHHRVVLGYHQPSVIRDNTHGTDQSINRVNHNAHTLNHHHRQMHNRIKQYIDEHLRVCVHLPKGVKVPRLDSKNITPYAGGSSITEFWTWLKSLVIYLKTSQLGGLDRDREWKLLIEPVLTGTAKKWYHDHVIDVNAYTNWTFVSVIIGLYGRFIHDSAMQETRLKFD